LDFEIITAPTDETLPEGVHPRDGVGILAERKGAATYEKMNSEARLEDGTIIISADTLVEADGVALGKPEDETDAARMLRLLSGRWHNVHTRISVRNGSDIFTEVASTAVLFRELSDQQIWEYIKSGEPMDKAGSYGIQGLAGKFVERIDGEFDTVVGLSVKTTLNLMTKCGFVREEKQPI
jgi:septum formation protein